MYYMCVGKPYGIPKCNRILTVNAIIRSENEKNNSSNIRLHDIDMVYGIHLGIINMCLHTN